MSIRCPVFVTGVACLPRRNRRESAKRRASAPEKDAALIKYIAMVNTVNRCFLRC